MTKDVEQDLLREVTMTSLRAYDALKRVGVLAAEGAHAVSVSEQLLRRAGLMYLLTSDIPRTHLGGDAAGVVEEVVQSYVDIQLAQAKLKSTIYDLAMEYIAQKQWNKGRILLDALAQIDEDYRDAGTILQNMLSMRGQASLETRDWKEAIRILKEIKATYPNDMALLRDFLSEYMSAACAPGSDSATALTLLSGAEAKVNNLNGFDHLLDYAREGMLDDMRNFLQYPLAALIYAYPDQPPTSRKKSRN